MAMNLNAPSLAPVGLRAPQGAELQRQASTTAVDGIANTFSRLFDEVNSLQLNADRKVEEFATSKEKDVHGTMIALQKADLSLRLLLQVRSKLTAAYQEIMRIQL